MGKRIWISWALILTLASLSFGEGIYHEDFEKGKGDWSKAGKNTYLTLWVRERHSGKNSLKIVDRGPQKGQANTSHIKVEEGKYYRVSIWVKIDPDLADKVRVDLTLWDKDKRLMPSGKNIIFIGETKEKGKWVKLSNIVKIPKGVSYMIIRVMPAFSSPDAYGACWFDDVKVEVPKEIPEVTENVLNHDPEGKVGRLPPCLVKNPTPEKPLVDFEDLSGWKVTYPKGANLKFYRSRAEMIHGKYSGRLIYTSSKSIWVRLTPPHPIPIDKEFDSVEMWVYRKQQKPDLISSCQLHSTQTSITLTIKDKDGKVREIDLSPVRWAFWSISHRKLKSSLLPPSYLLSITLLPLPAGENREIFLDALTFYTQPKHKILLSLPSHSPFPTTPYTILPSVERKEFKNEVTKEEENFVLRYLGEERIDYVYSPLTGTLSDIKAFVNGRGPYFVMEGGGVKGASNYHLENCLIDDGKVKSLWKANLGGKEFHLHYLFSIKGKTLIVEASTPEAGVKNFMLGVVKGGKQVEGIEVPYLYYGPSTSKDTSIVYLLDRKTFLSRLIDWYNTNASGLSPEGTVYYPKTDGELNPLRERIFITLSGKFSEVLPNIPNPPSRFAKEFAPYVYLNMPGPYGGDTIKNHLNFLKALKGYGVDKLLVKHHAGTWSSHSGRGHEPWSQTDRVAENIPGGERGFKRYIKEIKRLGYKTGFYTEYTVSYNPINSNWNEDYVSLDPEGQWRSGWIQCKILTPLKAWEFAKIYSKKIERKYDADFVYDDCMTCSIFWWKVDFDARKPYAGRLREVFLSYGMVPLIEKKIYGGPVFGEGGSHWFFAGLFDGNYASLRTSSPRYKTPFLVDFDLLKIHPLEMDLGMGWGTPIYDLPRDKEKKEWALDRFLAGTIAFGHKGVIYWPYMASIEEMGDERNPLGSNKTYILRIYFLMQQLQKFYGMEPVEEILYHNPEDGKFYPTSEAIRWGVYLNSQVLVKYENGLKVYVNGSFDKNWKVKLKSREYILPPAGFLAFLPQTLLEYGAILNGHRVDFVDSPSYIYADGRGKQADFGILKTSGQVIIKKSGRRWKVIIASGDKVELRKKELKGVRIVAKNGMVKVGKEYILIERR